MRKKEKRGRRGRRTRKRKRESPSVVVCRRTPGLAKALRWLQALPQLSGGHQPSSLRDPSQGPPERVSRQDLPERKSRGRKTTKVLSAPRT